MPRVRFSVRLAVAYHLGEDVETIEDDRRYQPTRTYCPVYTVGEDYLTATKGTRKPKDGPATWGWSSFNWVRVQKTRIPEDLGWTVWIHEEPVDDEAV